jgi:F-type H+-transporting ATPase subunit a
MKEHEIWLTALFNDHLAGVGNSILSAVHQTAENPLRPWTNGVTMELLVVVLLMILAAVLRSSLSVDKPGGLQHMIEGMVGAIEEMAGDIGIHHAGKYIPYLGTMFLFILVMNLSGVVPGFESATMSPSVPLGLAVCTFVYYNAMGVKELGVWKYIAHFAGPIAWLAPLMFPIEIISHVARLLSLTIRLWGNMFAGEVITNVFTGLTYVVGPALFMGLHVFVSFLQAALFVLLTMVYIGMATAHEH